MSTTNSEPDSEVPATPDIGIDVTETWPGRFALAIETDGPGISTTTTHSLDADQLRALADRIDTALDDAH
jgi:hypothetical protein